MSGCHDKISGFGKISQIRHDVPTEVRNSQATKLSYAK